MPLKLLSAECCPFRLSLNVLILAEDEKLWKLYVSDNAYGLLMV